MGSEKPGSGVGEKGLVSRDKLRGNAGLRICRAPSCPMRNHQGRDSSLLTSLLRPGPFCSHCTPGGFSDPGLHTLVSLPSLSPLPRMPFLSGLFSNLLVFLQKAATNSPALCLLRTSSLCVPVTRGTFTRLFINSLAQQTQISIQCPPCTRTRS